MTKTDIMARTGGTAMTNIADVVAALRCDEKIGGFCYKECKHREKNLCELSDRKTRHDAANIIESQAARIAELEAAEQWISVAERLPKESGRYIAYIDRTASEALGGNSKFIKIKMFANGKWVFGTHSPAWINGELKDTVTHWMPLPEPPKEG